MSDNNEDFNSEEIEIDLGDLGAVTSVPDEVEIDLGTLEPEPQADDVQLDVLGDEAAEAPETLEPGDEAQEDEVDKAVAALREELDQKFGEWYVIHTYSGMENRVKQNVDSRAQTMNMEDYIFETVVPTEEVVEIRNNARKTVTRCVLPGYVLVRMDLTDESWGVVRHTPSVTGFVGHGQTPIPLSVDEVVKMLTPSVIAKVAAEAKGPTPRQKKKVEVVDFTVGDSVMVTDGPFTGVHATITELMPNQQRLKALVEILGRETPVDLEFKQVEKVG